MDYIGEIIVAAIALVGTLGGSYMANKKTTALVVYRLEQLESKVNKHNQVIERTYRLEERVAIDEEKLRVANNRIDDLEGFHK